MKPQSRWNPLTVTARSWIDIQKFFAEIASSNSYFQPMSHLVSEIVDSEYSKHLFAAISMHTLIVSQFEEFEWKREVLEIELTENGNSISFQYIEHPYEKTFWKRKCRPEDAFHTFERFLEMKKWFLKYPKEM